MPGRALRVRPGARDAGQGEAAVSSLRRAVEIGSCASRGVAHARRPSHGVWATPRARTPPTPGTSRRATRDPGCAFRSGPFVTTTSRSPNTVARAPAVSIPQTWLRSACSPRSRRGSGRYADAEGLLAAPGARARLCRSAGPLCDVLNRQNRPTEALAHVNQLLAAGAAQPQPPQSQGQPCSSISASTGRRSTCYTVYWPNTPTRPWYG